MNPSRIVWINAGIFVLIAGVSAYVITQEQTLPSAPPVDELVRKVDEELSRASTDPSAEQTEFANFGKVNIFDTLVPLPTPTPEPPKTPPPPPDIREVVEFWRLVGATSSFAIFQDTKTREDFTLKVGESREEKFKGKPIKVFVQGTTKFKNATVMINVDDKEQTHVINMGM